ncbi:MAG: hypothetical protein OXC67_00740 [Flavobacteriaceae bacterium]|nr:hypothetical protein [Flavobacteriaceae bacterium]
MKTIPIILFIGSLLLACSKEGGDEDVFDRIDLVRVITPDFNGNEPYYFIDKYRISGNVPPFNRFSIDLNVYYKSVKEKYDEEFKWCFLINDMDDKVYVHSSTCLNYDLYKDDLDVFKFIEKAFDSFEKGIVGKDPKAKFIEDKFLYDNKEYELKSLDIEIGATFFTKEGKKKDKLYIVFFFENPNQTEYLQIFATYDGEKDVFELENILP